jgi:peptidoglycan glycosyltransferase
MSGPIVKLFGLVIVLFALLIGWTTRWTVIDAKSLRTNQLNRRTLIDEEKIKRGRILAADNSELARSVPAGGGTWGRFYPTRDLFAQSIGYSNVRLGQTAGLERSRGEELRGIQRGISTILGQLSRQRVGDDLYTTLDPKAQMLARDQLAGQAGSVVALDPQTGAVKVMYANPSYDDNHPAAPCTQTACEINRAVQASYPPGSTFKVVTAVAAIDSGKYTSSSTVDGSSPKTISGVPLSNDNNQSFGTIDLTTALTYSVNTVWAQVGESLGRPTMADYMRRFGFYSRPTLDYPPDEMFASGERKNGRLLPPASGLIDVGRMAIGQDKLTVTPMQMAMVAAAVANNGTLMAPHLADRAVDQDGRTVETIHPTAVSHVMKPATAQAVAQMMRKVVEEGTGTPAQLGGIDVAGKTGTAQVGIVGSNVTQPWFIGFAPLQNPKVAIAVTVERSQGGFGGTVAAPIAKAVIQTLLSESSK